MVMKSVLSLILNFASALSGNCGLARSAQTRPWPGRGVVGLGAARGGAQTHHTLQKACSGRVRSMAPGSRRAFSSCVVSNWAWATGLDIASSAGPSRLSHIPIL